MERPVLALVGHGTDASEGLEPGIHLRWAFRREVGFPLGGFCLFRRDARRPPMHCFAFDRVPLGEQDRVSVTEDALGLRVESERGLLAARVQSEWTDQLRDVLRDLHLPLPREQTSVVLRARAGLRVAVPRTPLVLLQLSAPRGRRISAVARALGREVARTALVTDGEGVVALLLEADLIDAVEVAGAGLQLVRVCVALPEPCESMEGWQAMGPCPLCLPVTHRGYRCKGRRPGCDEEEIRDRLPKDPCARTRFQGAVLDDLLGTLRAVVDPARGLTMATRLPDLPASNEDCPPPDTEVPELRMSALDVLLMAAVDPVIARVLGLYHVDASAVPGRRYDYKILGTWPEGTLWSLENTISFDEQSPDETVTGGWTQDDVTFAINRTARVVAVPTNFAGTAHALSIQPDVFDWSSFFAGFPLATVVLVIRFARPVGEVQLYARHAGATLRMHASLDGAEVAVAESTSPDAVLVAHAPGGIDSLVVEGDLRMLFRIDWESDYLAHGRHCHIVYGLTAGPPAPLAAPDEVRVMALRGVTRKESDCEPLGEGALADTRHLVGVRWLAPTAPDGTLLAKDPIRFRIERENPGGGMELVGGEDLVTVVPPDDAVKGGAPLDWPADRQHVVDVVPYPGAYRYRVEGVDIFGRQSGFGPWSDAVDVRPVEAPPPSKVTAKWLDPDDPHLTNAERAWVESGESGLLVGWEWLASQERQAPFVEAFQVLLERGWLNLVRGTAAGDPVETAAGGFTLDVAVDRALGAEALAGTTMSRAGTPYRIRSSTPTAGAAPFVTTLDCAQPASGMPGWGAGAEVAIPLLALVRATVQEVDAGPLVARTVRVLIGDLRAVPAGGLVGGAMLVGEERWRILAATGASVTGAGLRVSLEIDAGRGLLGLSFLYALTNQHVSIELPPASPPYVDYRNPGSWSASEGPVPAEGPGTYEVFLRQAVGAEAPGRTPMGARRHSMLTAGPLLDAAPTAYGQAALATSLAGVTGSASPAATFVRVDRTPPAAAAALPVDGAAAPGDTPRVYASLPDYGGRSSYHHRWPRANGIGYVVYRAFEETLFAVDRRVRGARSKVRADWDAFLGQFPDPEGVVRDMAFDLFVAANDAPDYAALDPKNRLLQILASFPDVLEAYTRLNSELIAWDDPAFADEATTTPGPGEPAYAPQANVRLYTDRSLPGQGRSAYFYRIGAVDALGNAGAVSIATAPVWLRDLAVPARPVISGVVGGDRRVALQWISAREPRAAEYRLHRAERRAFELDPASAVQLATIPVAPADPSERPATVTYEDLTVRPNVEYAYRLVVRDSNGRSSPPSAVSIGQAFDHGPPADVVWLESEWVKLDAAGGEHPWADVTPGLVAAVKLAMALPEAKAAVLVQREADGSWRNVESWLRAAVFDENSNLWRYELYDADADSSAEQRYRTRARSYAGTLGEYGAAREVPQP